MPLASEWREFTTMRGLAMRFRGILRSKNVAKLGVWLTDAHQSGLYAMQRSEPYTAARSGTAASARLLL